MKMKIVIVGLGGVGGYYGGLLAKKYADDPLIEIYFVARGEHLIKIQKDGLKVVTDSTNFVARPFLATDDAAEIGVADYVIVCTKSYDLESTITQIKPCIGADTVVLPLLNGIDNSERIRAILPATEVWSGCSYIVARKTEPGVIQTTGKLHLLNFGYKNRVNERLLNVEKILLNAEIDAVFCEEIDAAIWKKFCFISSTASLTSYYNVGFVDLMSDKTRKEKLIQSLEELILVANAEAVKSIDRTIIDKVIHRIESLPVTATSSMHSDFMAGNNTEIHGLTGAVLELGRKHNIQLPTYEMVFEALTNRMKV